MIKETISYEDFDGNLKTEDFHFHLTQAELAEWEASEKGGLSSVIEHIAAEENMAQLVKLFQEAIKKSYGKKTPDGRFIKNQELLDEFVSKQAYSDLFMKLATNAEAGKAFVNGIMPKIKQ